jgi:prevent-host-death family protein
MTMIVNIHAAKTHLSRLVDQATNGDEVVIARAGKPVAKLVPVNGKEAPARRVLGALAGRFKLPSDFDAPLPDDEIDAFEGR